MTKRYRIAGENGKEVLTVNRLNIPDHVLNMLRAGDETITITTEEAPESSPAALHHIRKGCCDGTDPVACYAAQQEREQREHAEQMAQQRAERAKASSPKPWDEFEGTD